MAAAVDLSELHKDIWGVQGPFFGSLNDRNFHQSARIWLKGDTPGSRGWGVSIAKGNNSLQVDHDPMHGSTAELCVIRHVNTDKGYVRDYNNPVTDDVLYSLSVSEIVEALRMLKDLPNDPDNIPDEDD